MSYKGIAIGGQQEGRILVSDQPICERYREVPFSKFDPMARHSDFLMIEQYHWVKYRFMNEENGFWLHSSIPEEGLFLHLLNQLHAWRSWYDNEEDEIVERIMRQIEDA